MTELSDEQIEKSLSLYGFTSTPELCLSIKTYISTLLLWNSRISLTTVTDPVEIIKFHFGESLFAASVVPIREGRLADVGSGAGFPGLALRLAAQGLEVTLIESNAKKSAFLSEVARKLNIDRVHIFRGRMEDLRSNSAPFDFVTARALGQHRELLAWAKAKLETHGQIVLWLGEDDARVIGKESGWVWRTPERIPGTQRRFILIGSPKD